MNCRDQWKLSAPIPVRVQEAGQLKAVSPLVIQVGDFVNVIAVVDIAHKRDYNQREVYVSFRPIEIVRLKGSTANVVAKTGRTKAARDGEEDVVVVRRTRAYVGEE